MSSSEPPPSETTSSLASTDEARNSSAEVLSASASASANADAAHDAASASDELPETKRRPTPSVAPPRPAPASTPSAIGDGRTPTPTAEPEPARSVGTISGQGASEPASAAPEALGSEPPSAALDALEGASLRHWIRRIEAARCDAQVTVESDAAGHGRLWCVGGEVIDAEYRGFVGEEAAIRVLAFKAAEVSVAFVPVERPRRIAASTPELLRKAALRVERTTLHGASIDGLPRLTPTPPREPPSGRTTLFYRPPSTGVYPTTPRASAPPPSTANAGRATTYLAGGIALVTLIATAIIIRSFAGGAPLPKAGDPQPQQVRAGLRPALDADAVTIEVEPPTAEIWLDGTHAGTGRLEQPPIRDGLVHQLRFTAPGYASKSLYFRDSPRPGTVRLEPLGQSNNAPTLERVEPPSESDGALRASLREPAEHAPVAPDEPNHEQPEERPDRGLRPARDADVSAGERPARSAAPTRPRKAKREPSKPAPPKTPHIRIIEADTPRVQVID